ncbi:MAG: SDR family NAD(P)-dependent oxidoreductase [Methanosarcinaceae archaeon]
MSEDGKLVLVTGGAGFIGSHLVEELCSRGYRVRVLDNLYRGTLEYIQPLIDEGRVEYIDGDIRYKDAVDAAMNDVDYVYHEAATNINRSLAYPEESFDINFRGSQVVFKSALDHNVKKVMFASSASVYGQPKVLPMSEGHELDPITPYCVSKLSSEYLLKFYARHGLKYVVFRYFNVYGLRQHTDAYYTSVIILFLKRLLNGDAPTISGSGKQSMDFINVKDIVRANIMALESDVVNEVINLGTGRSTSIKKLAEILKDSLGSDIEPIFLPRDVLVSERRADIRKAKEVLGFEYSIDVHEGLKEISEDIKKNIDRY